MMHFPGVGWSVPSQMIIRDWLHVQLMLSAGYDGSRTFCAYVGVVKPSSRVGSGRYILSGRLNATKLCGILKSCF